MFKGTFFETLAFLKRTDTLSTNAERSLRHFFDTLAFENASVSTRACLVFETRVFAHLRFGGWGVGGSESAAMQGKILTSAMSIVCLFDRISSEGL